MKKWMYILLSVFLLVSGCRKKEEIFDLDKLSQELPYLSLDEFDITSVFSSVEYENENLFDNLVDVYEYDYPSLGFSKENIVQAIIRISPTSSEMYMVFEAVGGKESALIDEIKNYLASCISKVENDADRKLLEKAMIHQEDDFIACIVSKNNKEILSRIQNSKKKVFGTLTVAKDEDLETYGLNKEMVEAYSIGKPVLTSSQGYLIVKPKDGQEENVSEAIQVYLKKLESYFANVSSELDLIHQAKVYELEGYQIMIISKDNDKVSEAIKTYLK